jgi:galactonate dehydratase
VKVLTNEGVTGLGEGTYTGQALSVEAAIKDRERIVVGLDPTNIEFIWQAIFRWPRARGGGVSNTAISGIEIALWDILGKVLDAPIYKLLGGAARERVRLYCHGTEKGTEGFTAFRTSIVPEELLKRPWNLKAAVEKIRRMREAVGEDADIIVDAHNRMTPVQVLEFCNAVEPFRLMFIEDPVIQENMAGLEWVQSHTNVPIAIGECNYTRFGEFRDIIFRHLANYVRPDVINTGGISETKKIGAMAESQFIDVALHVAPSPVSNLAATHVAASTPNCVIQENTGRPGRREQWVVDLFKGDDIVIKNGYAELPVKSGLGCDLDEKVAAEHPYGATDLPHNRYPDGSVSDW